MAVNYGALSGANFVSSQSGIIFRGLMVNAGITENEAFINTAGIFVSTLVIPLLVISVLVFLTGHGKAMKASVFAATPPTPLNREQRMTLWLTLAMMAIVLAAPIAYLMLPDNPTARLVNSKMDIGLIASLFSVIALPQARRRAQSDGIGTLGHADHDLRRRNADFGGDQGRHHRHPGVVDEQQYSADSGAAGVRHRRGVHVTVLQHPWAWSRLHCFRWCRRSPRHWGWTR